MEGRTPDQILKEIQELQDQLNTIQEQCSHPDTCVIKIPRSFTGNWDKGQDRYWYNCKCHLCGKKWEEDQ